jgi:very-short-patch-repair endonuclease
VTALLSPAPREHTGHLRNRPPWADLEALLAAQRVHPDPPWWADLEALLATQREYPDYDPDYRGSEEIDQQPVRLGDACKLLELAVEALKLRDVCESPIEIMLGAEIMVQIEPLFRDQKFELIPQYALNPYRFDFAVRIGAPILLIECDGAAFHTGREQRDHDRRKDQWAKLHGFEVVRFSGSEIHSRPADCVETITARLLLLHLRGAAPTPSV